MYLKVALVPVLMFVNVLSYCHVAHCCQGIYLHLQATP
jgi:hypothetical protein